MVIILEKIKSEVLVWMPAVYQKSKFVTLQFHSEILDTYLAELQSEAFLVLYGGCATAGLYKFKIARCVTSSRVACHAALV